MSTQYERARWAVTVFGNAATGGESVDWIVVGRVTATLAALIDPAHASAADAEFTNRLPHGLVWSLGRVARNKPGFSDTLMKIANHLKAGDQPDESALAILQNVADHAQRNQAEVSSYFFQRDCLH